MEVSPKRGTTNDTFIVTVLLEVEGIRGVQRFEDPTFAGFELLGAPLQNDASVTRFDEEKGRTIISTSLRRYRLVPKRPGQLTIGAARIKLGGKKYKTTLLRVRVERGIEESTPQVGMDPTLAGGVGAPGYEAPSAKRKRPFFLHAVTDKRRAYVGEQVTVTWLLFGQAEVFNYRAAASRLDDFWVEDLFEPTRFDYHDTVLGDEPYLVSIVQKKAVFAKQAGTLTVPPLEASVTSTRYGVRNMRSAPVVLEVLPLPPGAPEGFSTEHVGEFVASASIDRASIEHGGALTLSLTLEATRGAIRHTVAPRLEFDGFRVRAPRDPLETVDLDGGVVSGKRVYQYWMTPRLSGQQMVPSISVPYFDPTSATYKVATTTPIPVLVRGAPGREVGDAVATRVPRGIRLAKEAERLPAGRSAIQLGGRWFWLLALLPPALFLLVFGADRAVLIHRRDTPRSRLRKVRWQVAQRVKAANQHLQNGRTHRFFQELTGALSDRISERLGESVRSMPREDLLLLLRERGFSDSTVDEIEETLSRADFARFAPNAGEESDLAVHLEQVRSLLAQIERERGARA